jgi:hypothetical protein
MGARAVSGFALSAALQTVECLSGKWREKRISRYRAGRLGTEGGDERWNDTLRGNVSKLVGREAIEGVGEKCLFALVCCHMQAVCTALTQ